MGGPRWKNRGLWSRRSLVPTSQNPNLSRSPSLSPFMVATQAMCNQTSLKYKIGIYNFFVRSSCSQTLIRYYWDQNWTNNNNTVVHFTEFQGGGRAKWNNQGGSIVNTPWNGKSWGRGCLKEKTSVGVWIFPESDTFQLLHLV